MLKDITIGQYFPGGSVIHRLDPRIKIVLTFVIIVCLFVANNIIGYGICAFFIFTELGLSRVPVKYVFKGLRPLLLILLLTIFVNMLMVEGQVIYSLGPLNITREGLMQAGRMAARLVLLVMGASLLTLTTSPIALTDGIEKLLNPFRRLGVPAHELAMMMTIALRFIPTLLDETDKIMKAQMARGADFESGNLLRRAKNLVPLLVPLFISAFRRADDLALAMESRCYRGGKNRTRMKVLMMARTDYFALVLGVLTLGVTIASRGWQVF
jgi:energy-coupling factor transport system permease protein